MTFSVRCGGRMMPARAPRRGVPEVREEACLDCGGCLGICPHEALSLFEGRIRVLDTCTECDLCVRLCPVDALVSVAPPGRA